MISGRVWQLQCQAVPESPTRRLYMRYRARWLATLVLALSTLAAAGTTSAQSGKVEVLWLGQAAFKITTVSGKVIVIDPFLTQNPKTPQQWKNLDALGKVDLVLVTHAHADHIGDAPDLAKKTNAPVYAPPGFNQTLVALGLLPANLSPPMNKAGIIPHLG